MKKTTKKTVKDKASAARKRLTGSALENTKYAKDLDNTKYAKDLDNTKYAKDLDNTKYAKDLDNTKYARDLDNTKYAKVADHTKYARDAASAKLPPAVALARRQAIDAAVEETLMSVTAAVDRVHAKISGDARAQLVATMIDKFGGDLLEAHLEAIESSDSDQ